MQSLDYCIYHGNCPDGFTAAWAVWQKYGYRVTYFAGKYGVPPPDVTGKHVLLVDFSYSRAEMEKMASVAASITILDHHKTARENIAPLLQAGIVQGIFDMEKSGARLAYEWANPGCFYIPKIVQHVEDRDLWRYAVPYTKEICSYLDSYEYSFELWEMLWRDMEQGHKYEEMIRTGGAIRRKFDKEVKALAENAQTFAILGFRAPLVNCSYLYASDVGNALARREDADFGATYYIDSKGDRIFSLRSIDSKIDVSKIAEQLGGGGHRNASGFRISYVQAKEWGI